MNKSKISQLILAVIIFSLLLFVIVCVFAIFLPDQVLKFAALVKNSISAPDIINGLITAMIGLFFSALFFLAKILAGKIQNQNKPNEKKKRTFTPVKRSESSPTQADKFQKINGIYRPRQRINK